MDEGRVLLNCGIVRHKLPDLWIAPRDGLFFGCGKEALDHISDKKDYLLRDEIKQEVLHLITTPVEHEKDPVSRQKVETDSNGVISISSLPSKIFKIIFSLVDKADVISFGLTNQYLLSIVGDYLYRYPLSSYGKMASLPILATDSNKIPDKYPPNLFSKEELDTMTPLSQFMELDTSRSCEWPGVKPITQHWRHECHRRGLHRDPGYQYILPYLRIDDDTYLPPNETWVLRNLTTKQIIKRTTIPVNPEFNRGPRAELFSFYNILADKGFWPSTSDETYLQIHPKGEWAGHRLQITTLSSHEEETKNEEWTDISDEIREEHEQKWINQLDRRGPPRSWLSYKLPEPGSREKSEYDRMKVPLPSGRGWLRYIRAEIRKREKSRLDRIEKNLSKPGCGCTECYSIDAADVANAAKEGKSLKRPAPPPS
ncbi:hypothetical protein GQX73_g4860 [Xylaria multiplex]|uniref:F-box domain-containing protein n=1 Tax=Xylaria multiplex TaxID=323545 RepID=A0A7C8MUB6_9PEZI|nr:hypothetical protein GQX73_g4860 [Xylaria multiplex]